MAAMKKKILVTRWIFPEIIERLAASCVVDFHDQDTALPPEMLADRLADKDGAITFLTDRIDGTVLAHAKRLKVVSNVAVGYNNFDLAALTRAGVMATNTPDVLTETTADTVWALLLASARRVVAADKWVRAGNWKGWQFHDPWYGQDVHHATLGILGMGRIGRAVARRASGFAMRVLYHNRHRLPPESEAGAQWVAFDELLAQSDFLVVMIPYSPAVHHLIDAEALARMKPTAHLINVARGGIVDEAALIEALQHNRIAGAALDVFENEPHVDPRFFALENVVLTPHIGSSTRATRFAMASLAADNLLAALAGRRPPNLLNPEVLAS